MKVLLLPTSNS